MGAKRRIGVIQFHNQSLSTTYNFDKLDFTVAALEMATGTISVSFPTLNSRCSGLSYSESVDFTKVAYVPNSRRSKSSRIKRLSVTNSSNSGSDTFELQPVSDGSLPLGIFSPSLIS